MEPKYEIIKKIGVLEGNPEGYCIEMNIISWDGNPPKLDIRKWNHGRPTKGLCLSEAGLQVLRELIKDVTL
ncbi:MAG: hypothetical protein ABS879_08025 [Eubacteriales bacterium]